MVSKRAKNLILLSQSGYLLKLAQALVSELRDAGMTVAAAACDVADEADLAVIFSQFQNNASSARMFTENNDLQVGFPLTKS
jgi:hypothetical protein